MVSQQSVAGIAMLLWTADPDVPHQLATPFFCAAAAAAMDKPVEIYFTARSVRLLVPGVAHTLRASPRYTKTILDAMQEATAHGAVLLACTDALRANGIDPGNLIPECSGHGGAVQFMARVETSDWRTLVF